MASLFEDAKSLSLMKSIAKILFVRRSMAGQIIEFLSKSLENFNIAIGGKALKRS